MKKIIFVLCSIVFLSSCSSDDDDNDLTLPETMTFSDISRFLVSFGEFDSKYDRKTTDNAGTATVEEVVIMYFDTNSSGNRIELKRKDEGTVYDFGAGDVSVKNNRIEFSATTQSHTNDGDLSTASSTATTGYFKNKQTFHFKTEGENEIFNDGLLFYTSSFTENYTAE